MIPLKKYLLLSSMAVILLSSCSKGEDIDNKENITAANEGIDPDAIIKSNDNEIEAESLTISEAAAQAVQIIEDDAQQEISNLPPLENISSPEDISEQIEQAE